MIKTIYITYGLPASGKTRWSKELLKSKGWRKKQYHIEMDNYIHGWDSDKKEYFINDEKQILEIAKSNITYYFETSKSRGNDKECDDELIIDGLFTSNESLVKIIKYLKKFRAHFKDSIKIVIVRFNADAETCLWNDKGRKDRFGEDKNAKVSIKNIPLEEIDLNSLKEIHKKIEIKEVNTEKKSIIKNFLYDDGMDYADDKITSETWSTGGDWANCWGDSGDIEVEEPVRFLLVDKILEKCGAMHLYDEIIEKIAIEEDGSEADYYGGCAYYSWYEMNIDSLEQFLKERGYLRNLLITDMIGEE
jgi:adenylate kinase family enzyme